MSGAAVQPLAQWAPAPRVLIVDDEPANLLATEAVLEGLGAELSTARSGADALRQLLHGDFAVIVLDVKLPDMDGFELAALIRQRPRSQQTPIIFVTGYRQEEFLHRGYRVGGVDMLFKPVVAEALRSKVSVFLELHRKSALVEGHAAELERRVKERTAELSQALDALRDASERVRLHLENSPLGVVEWDPEFRVLHWNGEAARIFGWRADEVIGRRVGELRWVHEDEAVSVRELMAAMISGKRSRAVAVIRNYTKDGSVIDCEWYTSALTDRSGRLKSVLSFVSNVTERQRTEEQLRQGQRLESLGVLAGGVAHDFNNLLTGILGTASLLADDVPDAQKPLVESILRAGESAAHLTSQLLAYAGKGQFTVGPVDLSDAVREIAALVEHTLPRNVSLKLELAGALPPVETDPVQMNQVAMNLILNGAEAIPQDAKGMVCVRTSVRELGPEADFTCADGSALPEGRYVALEVSDTGCGIDESTLAHIFEPFFTTKFTGRGLGLAAVHGIVRNGGGGIGVETGPGKGTTFSVLMPAMARKP